MKTQLKNKLKVTIGIPAYKSQNNIVQLLNSLLTQNEVNITIEKIIVYDDYSQDNTTRFVSFVQTMYPKKIKIYTGKENHGYAYALQYIISKNKSEILVLLNDDIKIDSNNMIENLVYQMRNDPLIGLTCGNIVALPPKTFIGRCIYTSYLVFTPLRVSYKKGVSGLTIDGKIMALRKSFADKLALTKVSAGNVDVYIYFKNIIENYKYAFAKNAEVKFRLPETRKDYRNQELRTKLSHEELKKEFGMIVDSQWSLPKKEYFQSLLNVFLRYPIESLFFKFLINSFYTMPKEKAFKTWTLAESTKQL